MKKAVPVIVVACLAIACAAYASPKIHVDKLTYDFGSILEGFAVTHVFTIENTGDELLEILQVAASCGCTTTELATDRLAPGESVDLEVLVDTAGFNGRIIKSIYVYTNDPDYAENSSSERPRFTLRITGEVVRMQNYQLSVSDMNYLFTLLVDLRNPMAYEEAHLLGSISIPYELLSEEIDLLPVDAFIVLYDQDGTLGKQAAEQLAAWGYSTAYYTLGGLDEWMRWYETFFLEAIDGVVEVPAREGGNRLECPNDRQADDYDPLCSDTADLRSLLYLLIDLRKPDAYAESHLFGAINIPYTEISSQLASLPNDVLIIVYDDNAEQSDAVAQMLANAGFTQTRSLLGGLSEWIRQFGDRFVLTAGPE